MRKNNPDEKHTLAIAVIFTLSLLFIILSACFTVIMAKGYGHSRYSYSDIMTYSLSKERYADLYRDYYNDNYMGIELDRTAEKMMSVGKYYKDAMLYGAYDNVGNKVMTDKYAGLLKEDRGLLGEYTDYADKIDELIKNTRKIVLTTKGE